MLRRVPIIVLLVLLLTPLTGRATQDEKRVKAPKSDDVWDVKELGYLEAEDDLLMQDDGIYAFVVYTRTAKKGEPGKRKRQLAIKSNLLSGVMWTPERGESLAARLEKEGKASRLWGNPFKPAGPDDPRKFEYRFHQKDGKPQKIEIFAVTRDEEGEAQDSVTLEVKWPFGKDEENEKEKGDEKK